MSSIPNSNAFNWVIGPAGQCVKLVGEATVFPSLLHRAVMTLEGQPTYLELAHQHLLARKNRSALAALARLKIQARDSAVMAREHIESDFDSINKFAVIGLWVPIEVAVEDTCLLILVKTDAYQRLREAGFKIKPWSGVLAEPEARAVWRKLEVQARDASSVADGYTRVLTSLGVVFDLDRGTAESLAEMNYVRNCVLHRAGVIDDRVKQQAPNLGLNPGANLTVSTLQLNRYIDASHKFALALLKAVMACEHVRMKPSSN